MIFNLDTVPLPLATTVTACARHTQNRCDRSPKSFDTIRKFVAECGSRFIVAVTKSKNIRSITKEYPCVVGCPHCEFRRAKIRELIAAGK